MERQMYFKLMSELILMFMGNFILMLLAQSPKRE